jgi:thermopsin
MLGTFVSRLPASEVRAALVAGVVLAGSLGLVGIVGAPPASAMGPHFDQALRAHVGTGGIGPSGGPGSTPSPRERGALPVGVPPRPLGAGPGGGDLASLVDSIRSSGVPLRFAFLPNLDGRMYGMVGDAQVNPTYTTAPAPMGIAYLGLVNQSGTILPTTLTTPRLEGSFAPTAFSGISTDSGAPDAYGVQLNAVLNTVSLFGNSSYQFWTQNVVEYSTFSHQLLFLDNVWNFSGPGGTLSPNAILAHGPNGTQVGTTFYYALGPVVTIDYPFTLALFLNTAVGPGGNMVYFNYTLANATRTLSGSYDFVEFNSTIAGGSTGGLPPALYRADGTRYNPVGLPDDFEITVGGPGGGSNFDALNASAALGLSYWSTATGAFAVVPSAYDAGAETGETSAGLASTWTVHGDSSLGGTQGPAAHLGQGPSLLSGEWNVSPTTSGQALLQYRLAPWNGFTFIGPGPSAPLGAYAWAPAAPSYDLPPGPYSVWSLASEFAPAHSSIRLPLSGTSLTVRLVPAPANGVYTPLWAFDPAGLSNVSARCASGACTLDNNEVGTLGQTGPTGSGTYFPWFGEVNDFFFPVFPGIFLWNLQNVVVASPPTFEVTTPPWLVNSTSRFGTPASNDLGLFFYDDRNVTLTGAAAIGGWWFDPAYFGPAAPQYSVVFWNTSASSVAGNTFTSGGGGLYLYGGENNSVRNNTFLEYLPLAANEGSISGAVHGTSGLFDADFGDARTGGSGCSCGDLVYNNLFGDYHTAYEPSVDPYTGLAPRLPFDSLWNVAPQTGPNLLGGPELGGNYWWDYGMSTNPYWVLPYNSSGAIQQGGDAHPLLVTPLVTVTFQELHLPAGTSWHVGVYTSTGSASNSSTGPTLTERWPAGEYFFVAGSVSGSYGLPSLGILQVGRTNLTDVLAFYPIFSITFTTVNFPSGSFWALTLSNPLWGGWIELGNVAQFPAELLASGPYNFTISPPAGFAASPQNGQVNLTANTTVEVTFSKVGTAGELLVTFQPAGSTQVWVDNQSVAAGTEGSFNLSLAAGIHSIEATSPGYYPYFNNVSILGGGTTRLSIVLLSVTNGTTSSLPWIVVGVLAAVVVGLALLAGFLYSQRRVPPPRPAWQYAVAPKR